MRENTSYEPKTVKMYPFHGLDLGACPEKKFITV